MGEALRLLRIFYGYKSTELAIKLGISQGYVSEIENDKRTPSLEVLDKYAKVFGMKKSTILLFVESLGEKKNQNKKEVVANAGIRLLKILERVGEFEND